MDNERWCVVERAYAVSVDDVIRVRHLAIVIPEDTVGLLPADEQWRVAFRDSDVLDDPAVGRTRPAPLLPDCHEDAA